MSSDTIFHKIARKEIPAQLEYEDDIVVAFKDINPVAPVHILIVPKRTIPTPADISTSDVEVVGHMTLVARQLADRLGVSQQGYRLVMNCGGLGGQTVNQLHLHLLSGREFSWPPG